MAPPVFLWLIYPMPPGIGKRDGAPELVRGTSRHLSGKYDNFGIFRPQSVAD